jgi:aspartate ammonia-lyase
VNCS